MFNKRKDTDRLTEAIVNVLRSHERGDVVPHDELEAASGQERGQARYYALVRRAREHYCQESGVWTREVPGVGFRLLSAQESLTEEQRYRRKRMRRQANIGHAVADALPDAGLTEHERRLRQHVLESHNRMRKEILAEERHEKWLLKPSADKPIKIGPPRVATGTE